MLYLLPAFIFGTALGSFINMAVYRLNKNQGFGGRSYCDYCKKTLSTTALIPFFSYFLLKGKSNCCNKKLSKECVFVEFMSGIFIFVISLYFLGYLNSFGVVPFYSFNKSILIGYFLFYSSIFVILATIFIYDLKFMVVPMFFVYWGYALVAAFKIVEYFLYRTYLVNSLSSTTLGKYILQTDYLNNRLNFFIQDNMWSLLVASGIALFFIFLVFITKGKGMGVGDIFVAPLLSFLLPYPTAVLYVFLPFIIGGIFGSFLLLFTKAGRKTAVPFVPFLIIGYLFALIFGDAIISLLV